MQLSEIHCIASGPSSAKAELAHLWCGCVIVSITAVVLFTPGPLLHSRCAGRLKREDNMLECIAKKTGMAE